MDKAVEGFCSHFRLQTMLRVLPLPCMIRCVPRFNIDFPALFAPCFRALFIPTLLIMSFKTCPASCLTVGRMTSFNKGAPTLLTMLNNLEPSPHPD